MKYPGPPDYVDQPLGDDGACPEAISDGILEVGDCSGGACPEVVVPKGQRLNFDKISDVPGAEGLRPYSGTPGVPPEVTVPYPHRVPNSNLSQKGLRIFSTWGEKTPRGFTSRTPPIWESYRFIRSPIIEDGDSAFWMVDLWAYERIRFVDGPVGPLPRVEIIKNGGASPDETEGTESSRLKARLMWWSSSGGTTRIVDLAQGVRCAVEAQLLTVEVLWPSPGTQDVDRDRPKPLTLAPNGGIVLDTEVGCAITATASPPGVQIMTNTMVVEPAAGEADLPVFIPPGTRRVTVFQSSVGQTMVPTWRLGRSVASPGAELGQIVLGANRRAAMLNRPGPSGMILTGPADANTDRLATFIFELEI